MLLLFIEHASNDKRHFPAAAHDCAEILRKVGNGHGPTAVEFDRQMSVEICYSFPPHLKEILKFFSNGRRNPPPPRPTHLIGKRERMREMY
jgi:hypothetical protein